MAAASRGLSAAAVTAGVHTQAGMDDRRPLAIAALEDKIVQRATAAV